MQHYQNRILDQFIGRPGVLITALGDARVLEARKEGITVKVTVPDHALEWFVDVVEADLHDWVDYAGYDSTPDDELVNILQFEVCSFVTHMLERELRVRVTRDNPVLEWKSGDVWEQALPFYQESKVVRFLSRADELFVALLCLTIGGLISLTSLRMLAGIYMSPETAGTNFFWVALVASIIAPTIFVAGVRLLFNRPTKSGGLFSPFTLTVLAVFHGVLGGLGFVLALQGGDVRGTIGGAFMLFGTQAAFLIARRRKNAAMNAE